MKMRQYFIQQLFELFMEQNKSLFQSVPAEDRPTVAVMIELDCEDNSKLLMLFKEYLDRFKTELLDGDVSAARRERLWMNTIRTVLQSRGIAV